MFCKTCNEPCMPQFDYCHKHRVERKKKEFKKARLACPHVYFDGGGHYCKLISMEHDKDYPHKHYRVMCFGNPQWENKYTVHCEGRKRGLLK